MPPELGRTKLTHEEREEALKLISELFGIDTDKDPDPFIDLNMVAELAGVAESTPGQWQQRTKKGEMGKWPFPEPDDQRYRDKPQWCAISTIIEGFLLPRGAWPRGAVARPNTRGRRANTVKISLAELIERDAELAAKVARLGLADGQTRTALQWKYRVRKAENAA